MSKESLEKVQAEAEKAWKEFCDNDPSTMCGMYSKAQRSLFFSGYYAKSNELLRERNTKDEWPEEL